MGSNNNTNERLIYNLEWKQETMVHNKHSILNTWPKKKIEQKLGFYHIICKLWIKTKRAQIMGLKPYLLALPW